MTHPTEAELEEMARDLYHTGELSMPYRRQISDAITALRAQLAEVRADLTFMTENRNKWQDSATQRWFRIEEANARADRAEAALAAQIEADAAICTDIMGYDCMKADGETYQPMWVQKVSKGMVSLARQDIRNQPHDRTALDRTLREAILEGMRIATFTPIEQVPSSVDAAITALIEQPKETK